ncbi:hypothetical protein HHK36_005702 [Tetracentron sinense]|uniref:Uncharacterized protein n=1 Tax=Tetracentron sinense TaxID=13715 RepID=A0A835DQW6_TETSI|nr:hypothetical protein HHK36_005702 [Tetracentron sinense]
MDVATLIRWFILATHGTVGRYSFGFLTVEEKLLFRYKKQKHFILQFYVIISLVKWKMIYSFILIWYDKIEEAWMRFFREYPLLVFF